MWLHSSKPLPALKSIDQVELNTLQGVKVLDGAGIVQLKDDSYRVSQAARDAHIEKIRNLSQENPSLGSTNFPGIEATLDNPATMYVGYFHPKVVEAINASPVRLLDINYGSGLPQLTCCRNYSALLPI
jgi:hypothetical protein